MNIKGIHPLHFLLYSMEGLCPHVVVGHKPGHRGDHYAEENEVHHYEAYKNVEEVGASCLECDAVSNGCHSEEKDQDHHKGRIVSGPLILGLLPVGGELIHLPRCNAEVEHLCKRVVDVHLRVVQHPPQVFGERW